jgi:hypothetical protein
MGELSIALHALRSCADRVAEDANSLAETAWPAIDAGALRGSAVAAVDASSGPARMTGVVADLREWVELAYAAGAAFGAAEGRAASRLAR